MCLQRPSQKRYLGVYPLIEIYLFVNPLGNRCAEAEKLLIDFTNASTEKIDLHILPLVNQRMVQFALGYQKIDLETRNNYCRLAYTISLDFKAAQIQGKKSARQFLLALQNQLLIQDTPYSEALVKKLFIETGGDYGMFAEDRRSPLVKELFWNDQRTARELHVSEENTAVVYNCYHEGDGLLLEGLELIQEVLEMYSLQEAKTIPLPIDKTNKAYN